MIDICWNFLWLPNADSDDKMLKALNKCLVASFDVAEVPGETTYDK